MNNNSQDDAITSDLLNADAAISEDQIKNIIDDFRSFDSDEEGADKKNATCGEKQNTQKDNDENDDDDDGEDICEEAQKLIEYIDLDLVSEE